MRAELLIVQICDFLDDGDGHYRLHEPSRQLSRLPGVVVIDCHFYHRYVSELVDLADVLILPFVHNHDFFPRIEERRRRGKVTVFEANDYFYDVQPWSPIAASWQDRGIQEEYRHYMQVADAVQTSSDELAREWSAWARKVVVFHNHLAEIPPLRPSPARPLTIGWGGSPGHFADWYAISPYLERWLTAHPDVHLAVMTNEFARPFMRLPPERYHFTPFGTLASYLQFLPQLDIGLAPLLPSDYNRCRSDVKFLEYAAHGVAGIYAEAAPYRTSVVAEQTGLLYRTPEELLAALDRLARDAELRQRIRVQAHAYVVRERYLPDRIPERLAFYRQLLPSTPAGATLGPEITTATHHEGRYLQLRPGPPERTLIGLLHGVPSPESVRSLQSLTREHPSYAAAVGHLGRTLNDLKEYRAALPSLEQARHLQPLSASVLAEMGRAYFVLGDRIRALALLRQAIELNPWFLPGWQYLLRLLELQPGPEGVEIATAARARFPDNYLLALMAVRVLPAEQRLASLGDALDHFKDSFAPEEFPAAAAAFSQAIAALGPLLFCAAGIELVEQGVSVFPDSARLADLLGHLLFRVGRDGESYRAHARALELRRAAQLFQSEFPKEDGSVHYWQFADHIQRWEHS